MPDSEEAIWLLQAQSGDRDALDKLLSAMQARLHRYLRNLVRDEHLALDLLQDVFLIVVQKLRWLREPSAFQAWVFRIASRQAFRALKVKRTLASRYDEVASLEALAADAPDDAIAPESLDRLPAMLREVSPASRAVLALHYLEGMTLQEVADILEIPVGTSKARLAYGLQALRKKLKQTASQ
jgi:RNA polymerase sigma-70 factor (ECF subfamily)